MEKAKETLKELKSIVEDGIFEYNEDKISLYEIISLLREYNNIISSDCKYILNNLCEKVRDNVKINVNKEIIVLSINTVKYVKFLLNDDDLSVIENESIVKKPLEVSGKEILDYYNLVSPLTNLNDYKIDTEKAEINIKTNNEFNINVKIKNTDLSFKINCGDSSFDIDYNSLKVLEFLKEYSNSLLKSIFVDKIQDFSKIEERLEELKYLKIKKNEEKINVKKKTLFDVFKRK